MKKGFKLLAILILIGSCTTEDNVTDNGEVINDEKPVVGEMTLIETLFGDTIFTNPAHYDLLKELDMCDSIPIAGSPCAVCSPDYFKLFPIKGEDKIQNSFALQIKALTILKGQQAALPMRHLIVFERENGELIKVNGFRGNLIAMRESNTDTKDLIIRFYIPEDDSFLNCLFEWDITEKQYQYKSVEAIDWGEGTMTVKASLKDSVSQEVYQSLMSNAMLF